MPMIYSNKPESEPSPLQDVMFSLKTSLQESNMRESSNDTEDWLSTEAENKPEIVTIVEKISAILSPYFIVVVGLFLYDSNIFIGTVLILVGILSLLNISYRDLPKALEWVKSLINEEKK
jgi:hypothetical protein